jgi:hypothetical protein
VILEVRLDPSGKFVSGKLNSGPTRRLGIPVLDNSGAAVRKIRALSEPTSELGTADRR